MRPETREPLVLSSEKATRPRWLLSLFLGTTLSLAGILLSQIIPTMLFGEVEGAAFGLVGLIQLVLVPLAVWVGLRPVGIGLKDIGLRGPKVLQDFGLGLSVALLFAILQFTVLIPETGGSTRSDVVANVAQIGESWIGVLGFLMLAWTSGLAEELLFRGHFLTTLRNVIGNSRPALAVAFGVTVVFFAALHGYQGWAGILDTGFYGGLTLTALFIARGGRLTACYAAHAGWNSLAAMGLYLWY